MLGIGFLVANLDLYLTQGFFVMSKRDSHSHFRHDFLLKTYFSSSGQSPDHYEAKEVNGFWLVKQWNGNTKTWDVAVHSQDSYLIHQQMKATGMF